MDEAQADTRFYRGVLDSMSDGVYFVDRARTITYWSHGAERLTGFSAQEVVGRKCYDGLLNHVDESGALLCGARCPLKATMADGQPREIHVSLHQRDGRPRPVWVRAAPLTDADGVITGAVEVFGDDSAVTEARARVAEVEALAAEDPLTGLGNRRFLESELETRLAAWARHGWRFGVLFLDLDEFKQVNDEHGHAVGDRALTLVAQTLRSSVRSSDTVSRYGGEEFVVVVADPTVESLRAAGERLRVLVESSPLVVGGTTVPITVSVGATGVREGDTTTTLLERADRLLYAAKRAGRNRVHVDD